MTQPLHSRRTALVTVGGTTLAVCLAGCSAAPATGGTAGGATTAGTGAGTTIKAAEVPEGSGTIVGSYVVTQPKKGTFEAFGSLCTHQKQPVQQVTDAAIVCGRNGSTFSLADGSVLTGPATTALTKATVTLSGDTLTIS